MRDIINNIFTNQIKDKKSVALLFSGGTDSLTCLFSLLDVGIVPTLYTFHLDGVEHKDLIISRQVAKELNLNLIEIKIEKNIDKLQRDVIYLTQDLGLSRKTNVQCTYPFLYVMKEVKETYVVSGLCADDLLGSSKSVAINYSKDPKGFYNKRTKTLENLYSSAYLPIKRLIEDNNKVFIAPYREENLIQYLLSFNWEEINKPKQKQISVNAYQDYYNKLKVYRRNDNLQVGSKIREWHNELLATELNYNNRKRVDEIYKDLNKEGHNGIRNE